MLQKSTNLVNASLLSNFIVLASSFEPCSCLHTLTVALVLIVVLVDERLRCVYCARRSRFDKLLALRLGIFRALRNFLFWTDWFMERFLLLESECEDPSYLVTRFLSRANFCSS